MDGALLGALSTCSMGIVGDKVKVPPPVPGSFPLAPFAEGLTEDKNPSPVGSLDVVGDAVIVGHSVGDTDPSKPGVDGALLGALSPCSMGIVGDKVEVPPPVPGSFLSTSFAEGATDVPSPNENSREGDKVPPGLVLGSFELGDCDAAFIPRAVGAIVGPNKVSSFCIFPSVFVDKLVEVLVGATVRDEIVPGTLWNGDGDEVSTGGFVPVPC